MRWFISWWVTAIMTGVVALGTIMLDRLATAGHLWASSLKTTLTPPIPRLIADGGAPLLIVITQLAFWVLVRLVLIRVFAYVNSEMSSSPRGGVGVANAAQMARDRRRTGSGRHAVRLFHNPSGWWLAPFAAALNVLVWSAASFELSVKRGYSAPIPVALWGLSMLFGLTLTAAMLTPDRPLKLRLREDPEIREPDPDLALPAEEPEGTSPALGTA